MTTIKGPAPLATDLAQGLSSDIVTGFTWAPSVDGVQMIGPRQVRITSTQPIDENPTVKVAKRALSVNDLFYNRIIIDPAELNLGNLLSSQTRTVKVWNGFMTQKSLDVFASSNAVGINVDEPVETPYQMLPLQELAYTFNFTLDGPAVIDAYFQWTVEGKDYIAHVTGSRLVVFPFAPNWGQSKITESL